MPRRGVRVLRRGPGPAGAGQPQDRVDRPDLYDPKINRSYAELAAHYGCLVDPARARRPADKPRVERPMPYVRDSLWRGREFTSLAQMQAEAERWSAEVAGHRPCRPLDGAAPAVVFAAVEKDALRPLPADPFVLATWATAKIGPDIHARVGKVLYSVPWRHIGKTADVRVTDTMVQFFIGGELVKTHPRRSWGKQTDFGDYPPEKIAFHMRTPAWCRKQAAAVGPACEQVIADLLADNALYRLRAAQGVVGLADRHDPSRLEAACAKAIAAGDPSYRTVKGILAAGTDRGQPPPRRPGTAAPGRSCTARRRSPTSWPCPARSPATSWTCPPRAAAPVTARHGHDRRRHDPGPAAGRAGARAARRCGVHRARRDQRAVPDDRARTASPSRCLLTWPGRMPGPRRSPDWPPRPAGRPPARRWVTADGDLAGHQVHIFTPAQDTP